jgi:hypothetical protein
MYTSLQYIGKEKVVEAGAGLQNVAFPESEPEPVAESHQDDAAQQHCL